jgi:restriction system protein
MSKIFPPRILSPNPGSAPVMVNTSVQPQLTTTGGFSRIFQAGAFQASGSSTALFASAELPSLLLQAIVTPGEDVDDGLIVQAAAVPWFKIVEILERDPEAMYQIDWRKWEEIVAGAYTEAYGSSAEVVLTPRSGDKGRDVIVTLPGVGSIRYFDQVKRYSPGQLVTAEEVRAMVGVLDIERNVSKGIITTTSNFAPGVMADENIKRLMPYRLELKPRDALLQWLSAVAAKRNTGGS